MLDLQVTRMVTESARAVILEIPFPRFIMFFVFDNLRAYADVNV